MMRHLLVTSVVLSTAIVVSAGCSSSTGSKTSATGQGSAAGVRTAAARIKPYLNPDPSLRLASLTKQPPSGKTITFITCPLPTCQEFLDGVQSAAAKVGWKVKSVDEGLTPDKIISTWNSVAQNPGDAVIGNTTLPNASIASSLSMLAQKHVPVVALGGPNAPTGPVIAQLINEPDSTQQSELWADWIVSDSNGKAATAFFWDPSFPSLQPYRDGFVGELRKLCADCTASVQTTSFATGIGKSIPSQIVSYAQRNQDVKYIVVPVGDAAVGVPQALAAAGLTHRVKLVTGDADTINMQAIAAGGQAMGIAGQSYSVGWHAVDLLIRHMIGMPIPETRPRMVWYVMTKANLPKNTSVPWDVPGYQNQFLTAWHADR